MVKLAILASGEGTTIDAVQQAISDKVLTNSTIGLVISDNFSSGAIDRAKNHNISYVVYGVNDPSDITQRTHLDSYIYTTLKTYEIDFVLLLGWMWVLGKGRSDWFEKGGEYYEKIVNIHPALLPSFKGKDPQKKALEQGVKVTGNTLHYVIPEVDAGPIISQSEYTIKEDETLDSLITVLKEQAYDMLIDFLVSYEKQYEVNRRVNG